MHKTIDINTAEMAISSGQTIIKTSGIGSCIVISLYDEEAKIGGMAHAILPSNNEAKMGTVSQARENLGTEEIIAKYADESIDRLIMEIEKIGGTKTKLKAKLVGGAKMFRLLSGDEFGIGYRNIQAAKKRLSELGIPIINEETGGTVGRMVEFFLDNGLMQVTTKM